MLFVIVILVFMGLCLYGFYMPRHMVKKGRQVDVRVLSCKKKEVEDSDTGKKIVYYNVTVDFYGLDGKQITKTLKSEERYKTGEVIRAWYLDRRGLLWLNADKDAQGNKKIWLAIGVLVFMLAVYLISLYAQKSDGKMQDHFATGFGYFIGILFVGIGILGIVRKINQNKTISQMQVIPGTLVDYTVKEGGFDEPCSYYPIYEFEWMGEKQRLYGNMGGNGKKYRAIGRKVHILREAGTGMVTCREDEHTSFKMNLVFGLLGVLVVAMMLAKDIGLLQGTQNNQAIANEVPALELYCLYGEEETEKCSYVVDIYYDRTGLMLLFPAVTVNDRSIDQKITFTLSRSDMKKISEWLETVEPSALTHAPQRTDAGEAQIALYLNDGDTEERFGGTGYLDDEVYGEAYELLQEIVPREAWEEMEKRVADYYQR